MVIDTADSCFGGIDDSSPVAMRLFVDACKRIRNELGCTVLIVAHPGHDNAERERGGSNLKAAVDVRMRVKTQGENQHVLKCLKQKNGPLFDPMVFERQVVEIGTDEDGDPITSCVLEYLPEVKAKATSASRGPSKTSRNIVDALDAALAASGQPAHQVFTKEEIGTELRLKDLTQVVEVEKWRQEAYRRILHDKKPDIPARQRSDERGKTSQQTYGIRNSMDMHSERQIAQAGHSGTPLKRVSRPVPGLAGTLSPLAPMTRFPDGT